MTPPTAAPVTPADVQGLRDQVAALLARIDTAAAPTVTHADQWPALRARLASRAEASAR